MNRLRGIFRLIRLPNLLFIGLTQCMLQACIYTPIYQGLIPINDTIQFYYLLAASLLIAAGGYIINDYFDVAIDEINRPAKLVVGKIISRRWAMILHFLCSSIGLFFTFCSIRSSYQFYLVPLNFLAILMLWFYSVRFKKSFLLGNLMISLLVAWTIVIFFLSKITPIELVQGEEVRQARFYQLCSLYAGFAFLSTMARELMKDVEDREGDRRHGCKTLPIVWGIPIARFVILLWLVLLLVLLLVVMIYLLQFKMRIAFLYATVMLVFPLIILIRKTAMANHEKDFGLLSKRMRWVLLAGIVSMIFFYF